MNSHAHESEWVYSSTLSKKLFTPLGEYIHQIPSVSHPIEFFLFLCGYAFNPAVFLFWPILIHGLSYNKRLTPLSPSLSSSGNPLLETVTTTATTMTPFQKWQEDFLMFNGGLYVLSVLVTLAFTEIGKASFATTRPRPPTAEEGCDNNNKLVWRRRYGKLVASLKSKHSFPSGDCAQAMNLCMFVWKYVPVDRITLMGNDISIDWILFGIFLPGVAFARVFYLCHWVEDCIGGIMLSWVLQSSLMPVITQKIMIQLAP